jgi:hypothetical protein
MSKQQRFLARLAIGLLVPAIAAALGFAAMEKWQDAYDRVH